MHMLKIMYRIAYLLLLCPLLTKVRSILNYSKQLELSIVFMSRSKRRNRSQIRNSSVFQQIKYTAIEGILAYQEDCEKESGTSLEHFVDVLTENSDLDRSAKCFAYCALRKNGLIDDNANPNIDKINEWFTEDNATQITDEQWKAKCLDFAKDDLCEAAFLLIDCLPYE